ncbi:O-acetyl-ADP-ribose deacetylase [Treponema pedis]|uniref:O-acetyl-ADP-ribose deacetylase n=1 Tax=Treponema pedis TaxID=409322 RepID=UPI00041395F0|nr:O-acetyl-ADP-ribose deacetylase [Treponema pedis]
MPIKIIRGDITKLNVDAIVNAANTTLLGGGGVDDAIHKAAGEKLLEECKKLNGCKTGEAKITLGYNLPTRFVIHTPGPVYEDGKSGETELLANSYRNSLQLAFENNCSSVAFPCISAGVYDYPKKEAAKIALKTILEFLQSKNDCMEVFLVCFDTTHEDIYKELLAKKQVTAV